MKLASRLIDLTSKKNKMHVQHTFSSNQQKTNLHAFLSFPCRCFFTTSTLFCTTKTSNFLVTHYFYGGIVVCAYQRFFSHSFSPGSQHVSFSHRRYEIVMFSSNEIRLPSSFSVIHVSVNIKSSVQKDTTLLLFFLSKSLSGHAISFQIKP